MDHQYPFMYASAPPTPGNMETGLITAYPPAHGLPVRAPAQQLGGGAPADDRDRSGGWAANDPNTLLVVATLITALAYVLGLSMPGGYWQGTLLRDDGRVVHLAGDPIMRDLHRPRYWVFRVATWVGVASSMVMTLSLLVRMAVDSRHVLWSFSVAFSSLVLTFIVSQSRTNLSLDILVWLAVLILTWLIIGLHPDSRARVIWAIFCGNRGN
ncbi:uncharacterized protein [Setaria viridis]|uniref:uncharacterized protein n=1 Tax=Setaria viridis TaxID=4556 RepID=UPI001493339C|nr:uncharacterized protein LOC117835769 [Setaria viridis]